METKNKELSAPEKIKRALQRGETLTGMDIITRFRCLNYKGRIHDLRRDGLPIRTTMVKTQTGKRIAYYSMIKKPTQLRLEV